MDQKRSNQNGYLLFSSLESIDTVEPNEEASILLRCKRKHSVKQLPAGKGVHIQEISTRVERKLQAPKGFLEPEPGSPPACSYCEL